MRTIYVIGYSTLGSQRAGDSIITWTNNIPIFATLTLEEAIKSIQNFKENNFTCIKYGNNRTLDEVSKKFQQYKDWFLMPTYINTDNEITLNTWFCMKDVNRKYQVFTITYDEDANRLSCDMPITPANYLYAFQVNTLCYGGLINGQLPIIYE